MNLEQSIKEHFEQASKNADIARAAEKLVKCKGRYHAELNYKALAELFGLTVPTVELESKWIKCSEKMPPDNKDIILNSASLGVFNGFFRKGTMGKGDRFFSLSGDVSDGEKNDITHWMPLPPPPNE